MFHKINLLFIMLVFNIFSQIVLANSENFFDLSATDIKGKTIHFSQYRGKVVLVVNTASQCGFTPQLKELEILQQKYKDQGFIVLAFPSNDFKQDPESNEKVLDYAKTNYSTTFPFFDKAHVKGPKKQAVYSYLIKAKPGLILSEVSWNFEKFLIDRKGNAIERWTSLTSPTSSTITKKIEKALAEPM